LQNKIETLKQYIHNSSNIVFFGGAGVSTESGIPDFRSQDGLYNKTYKYPPETILSYDFFINNTGEFFDFYKSKMIFTEALPNKAHKALAALEKAGRLKAVVTQNIDGLHQAAGSRAVFELHGSVLRNYCMKCKSAYGLDIITETAGIPKCSCGGVIKPDVVLYGESLDSKTMSDAALFISNADVLIVGGTSLGVYPAAGLINYYRGNKLALINKSPTPMDARANLLIQDSVGECLHTAASHIIE